MPQIKQTAERSLEEGQLTPNLISSSPPSSLARARTIRKPTPSCNKDLRESLTISQEEAAGQLDPSPLAQALPHKAAGFSGLGIENHNRPGHLLYPVQPPDKCCPCKNRQPNHSVVLHVIYQLQECFRCY